VHPDQCSFFSQLLSAANDTTNQGENRREILYLTNRPFSMVGFTRDFLRKTSDCDSPKEEDIENRTRKGSFGRSSSSSSSNQSPQSSRINQQQECWEQMINNEGNENGRIVNNPTIESDVNVLQNEIENAKQTDNESIYQIDSLTNEENEKEWSLPRGPLIMNSEKTISAIYHEVITRTAGEIKKRTLDHIRELFNPISEHDRIRLSQSSSSTSTAHTRYTPFIAGFGNQESDEEAYQFVGIPSENIFTIDPSSIISTKSFSSNLSQHHRFNGYSDPQLLDYCRIVMNNMK